MEHTLRKNRWSRDALTIAFGMILALMLAAMALLLAG